MRYQLVSILNTARGGCLFLISKCKLVLIPILGVVCPNCPFQMLKKGLWVLQFIIPPLPRFSLFAPLVLRIDMNLFRFKFLSSCTPRLVEFSSFVNSYQFRLIFMLRRLTFGLSMKMVYTVLTSRGCKKS